MKRKLTPLIACPELHHVNKTMIIETPLELRECGRPIFRIVSSLNDLEKPRVKFKANDLLKSILERGTGGKKLNSICVEVKKGNSLKLTELLCEKSNSKFPNEGHKTKVSYPKLSKGDTDSDRTIGLLAADNDPSHSRKGLGEAHKFSQKTFLPCVKEHNHPQLENFQNTGSECETLQQLSKSSHLVPHEQEILQHKDTKMSGKLMNSHNWNSFKDSEDFGTSQGVNGNINCGSSQKIIKQDGLPLHTNHVSGSSQVISENGPVTTQKCGSFAFGAAQNRDSGLSQEINHCKDSRSFQQKEHHEPNSLHQKDPGLKMCDKRNCNSGCFQLSENSGLSTSRQRSLTPSDPLCQHSDFSDFHQGSSNIHRSVDSAYQNGTKSFSQDCDSLKTDDQNVKYVDCSRAGPENVLSNNSSSWSEHGCPRQSAPSYSSNKNDKVIHQEEQKQRMLVQMSRSGNNRQHQVAAKNLYNSISEFPYHCLWKKLNWSEMKQILFLDVQSYPNFFRDFEKIPPPGMHFCVFMPFSYRLKYPDELITRRIVNMKLLHITLGDVNIKFPAVVHNFNCELPASAQFIIVSNKQFSIMESVKSRRTVNLVCPKFSEGMSDIYRYIFKVDA